MSSQGYRGWWCAGIACAAIAGCSNPIDAGIDASAIDAAPRDGGIDAFVSHEDAFVPGDAATGRDAFAAPDSATDLDAYVPPDAFRPDVGIDAGCTAAQALCGGLCVDVAASIAHCGDCTTTCSTTQANAHAVCAARTCGVACDVGYFLVGGACVLGVLDHRPAASSSIPLGDYRAFRGHVVPFQIDYYTFTLAVPSHVQIDLMGNVQAELTDAQIASGDATASGPTAYVNPQPSTWRLRDLTRGSTDSSIFCWSYAPAGCIHSAEQDIRYLRRSPASNGAWDGDQDMLAAGDYELRVSRGTTTGPYDELYYYGEIAITPD